MFDNQFYPTPDSLIKKMLSAYKLEHRTGDYYKLSDLTILEPSAGKGDIVDFISEHTNKSSEDTLYCVELNEDLQHVLREKGYSVLSHDFLEFDEQMYFDLIVMNPPFDHGAQHLLKALDIAHNTDIICVLNAETIRNPYSAERKLLLKKLEDLNATISFESEIFTLSEHRTNVEIALIKVSVQKGDNPFDFNFEEVKEMPVDFEEINTDDHLARVDMIGNLTIRYEDVRRAYAEVLKAQSIYRHRLESFTEGEGFISTSSWELNKGTNKRKFNYLSQKLKAFMWRKAITKLNVRKYMSAKVSENFEKFVRSQSTMAFNKENVARFFQMVMNNRVNIWDTAVEDVFDMFTSYYKENRLHVEGWKTNDKYKVNKKIILPNWCKWDTSYMSSESIRERGTIFKIEYNKKSQYDDIDKVMSYILGENLNKEEKINNVLEEHFNSIGSICQGETFNNKIESKYFFIKFFKKGTVHLEFKNHSLWEKFNLTACAHKHWLPADEQRKWEQDRPQEYSPPFTPIVQLSLAV